MPRPPRIDPDDGVHHVMNRGADRAPVFFADCDRIEFGDRLADIHERFGVEIHAYCLLDNHFHLLARCPNAGLSVAMQRLGSMYTRHVNDRLSRDGALFRGRFASRVITSERYLLNAVRYIHRNALDVAGVDSVEQYRWSSHRTYLGLRRQPDWLRTDEILARFGGDAAAFDDFVRSDLGVEIGVRSCAGLDAIRHAAEMCAAENGLGDHGRVAAVARSVALAWADRHGLDDDAVMRTLAISTPTALRMARSRVRRRMMEDAVFSRVVARSAELAGLPGV